MDNNNNRLLIAALVLLILACITGVAIVSQLPRGDDSVNATPIFNVGAENQMAPQSLPTVFITPPITPTETPTPFILPTFTPTPDPFAYCDVGQIVARLGDNLFRLGYNCGCNLQQMKDANWAFNPKNPQCRDPKTLKVGEIVYVPTCP